MRAIKGQLARYGWVVFCPDPPHRVQVRVGSMSDCCFVGSFQDLCERFRQFPADAENGSLASAGLVEDEVLLLQSGNPGNPGNSVVAARERIPRPIRLATAAAIRSAKIRVVAHAHHAKCRQTELSSDALGQMFLRCAIKSSVSAASAACHFWQQTARSIRHQWMATYYTPQQMKRLPAGSLAVQLWLRQRPEVASALTIGEIRAMTVPSSDQQELLWSRLQKRPEEGLKLTFVSVDDSPPLLELIGSPEPVVHGVSGARQVLVRVKLEPQDDRVDVVKFCNRTIGHALLALPRIHISGNAILDIWGNVARDTSAWMASVRALPCSPSEIPDFIPCTSFQGPVSGHVFSNGPSGLGYYRDSPAGRSSRIAHRREEVPPPED